MIQGGDRVVACGRVGIAYFAAMPLRLYIENLFPYSEDEMMRLYPDHLDALIIPVTFADRPFLPLPVMAGAVRRLPADFLEHN